MLKAKLLIQRARSFTNINQGQGWRNQAANAKRKAAKSKKAQLDKTRWLAGSLVTGLSRTKVFSTQKHPALSAPVVAALLRMLATDLSRNPTE